VPSPWHLRLCITVRTLNFDWAYHFGQTQRVFESWTTGILKDIALLSKDTAQNLTYSHCNGSVSKLKAAKLDEIVSEAYELITPVRVHPEDQSVVVVFDPSSSDDGSDEWCA